MALIEGFLNTVFGFPLSVFDLAAAKAEIGVVFSPLAEQGVMSYLYSEKKL